MAVDKIFRPRRGTQATMESNGTILKKGEMFFEYPSTGVGTGQCRIKMGDGTTAYADLPYAINLDDVSTDIDTSKFVSITTAGTTVGGTARPVYINSSGVATALTATVGSATRHMYMSSGTMTASSTTVGSGSQPIYMSSGTFTKCNSTVGSSTTPIYSNEGVLTSTGYDLSEMQDAIDNFSESFSFTEVKTADTSLDSYHTSGVYHFSSVYSPTDPPTGTNGWLINMTSDEATGASGHKQLWYRQGTANSNDWQQYQRTYTGGTWSNWTKNMNWNTERVSLTTSDGATIGYKWGRVIVYVFNGLTSDGLTSELQNSAYTPTKTFTVPIIIQRSGNYYLGFAYISSTASDSYVAYFASYGASSSTKVSASSDTCYGTCAYITNIND